MKLIYIPLEQGVQCIHSSLSIRAGSTQCNSRAGNNPQGHDTQQALGVHLAITGLQPDAALKLIGFLDEIGCLFVVQAGLTTNDDFFIEHNPHSFSSYSRKYNGSVYIIAFLPKKSINFRPVYTRSNSGRRVFRNMELFSGIPRWLRRPRPLHTAPNGIF